MFPRSGFVRAAGIAAVASGPIAVASVLFLFLPVGFDPEAFADAGQLLSLDPSLLGAVRWGLLLDLLGYYLLLAPLALATPLLLPRGWEGWGWLARWCGTSYALVGAIGAAGLAAVLPALADTYTSTTVAAERTTVEAVYTALSHLVVDGLWNTLEVLLAAVWFTVVGLAIRHRHRSVGALSLVLAGATALDTVGSFAGSEAIAAIGLNVYLVGAPVWAVAMGLLLVRRTEAAVAPARDAGAIT